MEHNIMITGFYENPGPNKLIEKTFTLESILKASPSIFFNTSSYNQYLGDITGFMQGQSYLNFKRSYLRVSERGNNIKIPLTTIWECQESEEDENKKIFLGLPPRHFFGRELYDFLNSFKTDSQ